MTLGIRWELHFSRIARGFMSAVLMACNSIAFNEKFGGRIACNTPGMCPPERDAPRRRICDSRDLLQYCVFSWLLAQFPFLRILTLDGQFIPASRRQAVGAPFSNPVGTVSLGVFDYYQPCGGYLSDCWSTPWGRTGSTWHPDLGSGPMDEFGAEITFLITVPVAYTGAFGLFSENRVQMFIDGDLYFDADPWGNNDWWTTGGATPELTPGQHSVKIDLFATPDSPARFEFMLPSSVQISAAPEPASLFLLASGLLGLAGACRKKLLR